MRMQAFTSKQNACIIGGLLGDLHIQKSLSSSGNCRLRFSHTWEQKEYLYWKYKLFENDFCKKTKPPYIAEKNKINREKVSLVDTDVTYKNLLFYTSYRKEFQKVHSDWYIPINDSKFVARNTKHLPSSKIRFTKRLPINIVQSFIDPLALAVWYLDDGSKRTDTNSCRIASHSFSEEEHQVLCDCMYTNFGITPKIETWSRNKIGETAYSIAILSRGGHYKKFRDILYPIVQTEIPSMLYKL